MTVRTALDLRMARAVDIAATHAIQCDDSLSRFVVDSQSGNGQYRVVIETDPETGWLVRAHCECPDFQRMEEALDEHFAHTSAAPHPGISHIDGVPVCKHVLAALIEFGYFKTPLFLAQLAGCQCQHHTQEVYCESQNR